MRTGTIALTLAAGLGLASMNGQHAHAQPSASTSHDFSGWFELRPRADDTFMRIRATGGNAYRIDVTWGGMTAGGNYNVDGWTGTGTSVGNNLTIRREGETSECLFTATGGARPAYRLVDCGGGDGTYVRVPAARARDHFPPD